MVSNTAMKELIVINTDILLLRAGHGNTYIAILFALSIIGPQFIKEFNLGLLGITVYLLISIYILFCYFRYVSKIIFYEDRLRIFTSVGQRDITLEEIEKISFLPSGQFNSFITLKFKLKNKYLPQSFSFAVLTKTNFGTFKETVKMIEEILTKYNVPYKSKHSIL